MHYSVRFTRSVLDALSKQFCVLDENGNILEVNKPWLDYEHEHEGSKEGLEIGQNYLRLLDEGRVKDRGGKAFAEGIRAVMKGEKTSFSLEYSHNSQGIPHWFAGKVIPFPDQALGRVIVVHENISEHKLLEHRFRQAVESSPSALVIVNKEGAIVMVNAQTEASFGYSREELVGQPVELLVPERFRKAHIGFRQVYSEDPVPRPIGAGQELYGLHKDGTEFPVEIGLSLIENHEESLALSSIVDISLRKQLEYRFRQAMEAAPNAIAMVNGSGTILMVNLQTERSFGYSRFELIGHGGNIGAGALPRGPYGFSARLFCLSAIQAHGGRPGSLRAA
ncbi:MAG: PAS domain S-box protein [Methylosarcina sp.]